MQILKLNNVGRKFRKCINSRETAGNKNIFGNFRPQTGDFWALRNIYMELNEGEIIGVIGRNGSGKTTLLNIVSGALPVSEGEVVVKRKVSALLMLGAGFQNEFTGKENIYLNASLLGLKKEEIDKRFQDILEFSELGDFINSPLGNYSSGMKMRLGFSVAIHNDFDILLTDEIITVGDISFQKKCFEKMISFKKQGKAMILVTQDMGMINRFCDRAYLLENGKIIFSSITSEVIERYEMLLNKTQVLSESSLLDMVKETKRWATDITEWGKKEGTREVEITETIIFNKWRRKINKINPGEKIIIRAYFKAKEKIDNFHFGVAIFREDGVYCYGPNTKFDGLAVQSIEEGEGYFELIYKELLLMPGIYFLSVVIWDNNETFAYDYHKCIYKIEVIGEPLFGQLLSLPAIWGNFTSRGYLKGGFKADVFPNLDYLLDKWEIEFKSGSAVLKTIKCFNNYSGEDSVFITGKDVKIKIDFYLDELPDEVLILWVGIYRSDMIYCHGGMKRITARGDICENVIYPRIALLPGGYRVSAGIWSINGGKFLAYSHGVYQFSMISEKRDHGTSYFEHNWRWKIPSWRKA